MRESVLSSSRGESTREALEKALAGRRYETARRHGRRLMDDPVQRRQKGVVLAYHGALVALGDVCEAAEIIRQAVSEEVLTAAHASAILRADYRALASQDHYRESREAREGMTFEEYAGKYHTLADRHAPSPGEQKVEPPRDCALASAHIDTGDIIGRLTFSDGAPISHALVVLGAAVESEWTDDEIPEVTNLAHHARIGVQREFRGVTSGDGRFRFAGVPVGPYDYLAVQLDPARHEIATRFVARDLAVIKGGICDCGVIAVGEWESPGANPPQPLEEPEVVRVSLENPFAYDFPRQMIRIPLPEGADPGRVTVTGPSGRPEKHQISSGELVVMASLSAGERSALSVRNDGRVSAFSSELRLIEESPQVWRVATGSADFRLSGPGAGSAAAPILGVCGSDGVWRGCGRFALPPGVTVTDRSARVLETGPLFLRIEQSYHFSNGGRWGITLTFLEGEEYLLAHEICEGITEGRFELSFQEFCGGRGFLHWSSETGSRHWISLRAEDRDIALLPEMVPWWIPPQGFAYAMTHDDPDSQDYVAVFTVRRGEWNDVKFAGITKGPMGRDQQPDYELDWPFPEMVGSSISRISAHTTAGGDSLYRFSFFEGERQWGLLVSTLAENDGPDKRLARVQHANTSPRLQDFLQWELDEEDVRQRPYLLPRSKLIDLRRKAADPAFGRIWKKICAGRADGSSAGLRFAVEGDAAVAWRRRLEILCDLRVRTRMTLLGRDRGDLYSPVGGRGITRIVEDYDLLAASGVFSAEEERFVRSSLMLLGHMFMEQDFFNWRYGSRNANFDADRVEIVGTIGLAFEGSRDAAKFLDHARECTISGLATYCTPESGKWYENPACYYLQALKCRVNLIYRLARDGKLRLDGVPRLKEFLRWGSLLLTPPQPASHDVMRRGSAATFTEAEKIRKIPPIGDHAGLGRWMPEQIAVMGKLFVEQGERAFGIELLSAYFAANADGARFLRNAVEDPAGAEDAPEGAKREGALHGNLAMFFTEIEAGDIPEHWEMPLASRRLEGFGAVMRSRVGTSEEGYVLIKQGPGGYRYQRTEGSFLFFSGGRPLVYDGGEAGEAWRHSTLSFGDAHMPMSAGRVERVLFDPVFQFTQGVHPEIIRPGEPAYLSDSCDHHLVEESYRRRWLEPPAVARSFAWVADEYLIIHDELNIDPALAASWNLHVVADSEGMVAPHFLRFRGRFGVDLQVCWPDQEFAVTTVKDHEIVEYNRGKEVPFSMRHLQLSGFSRQGCAVVLAPVISGVRSSLNCRAIFANGQIAGVRVLSSTWDDTIWFARRGVESGQDGVVFDGRYGGFFRRQSMHRFVLMGAGVIGDGDCVLKSNGPAAVLEVSERSRVLRIHGEGEVIVSGGREEIRRDGPGEWRLL